jgi:hypothetical protein
MMYEGWNRDGGKTADSGVENVSRKIKKCGSGTSSEKILIFASYE